MKKLNIQQYLENHTLEQLTAELAIKVKRHPHYPNLVLLNYCQLDSPRTHPIVIECRGIILDAANNWMVVNYPYDRFFNYEEAGSVDINWSTASVYEKLDGTLICLWNYNNHWHFSTRGTPDASGMVGDFGFNFCELAWNVFDEYEDYSLEKLEKDYCYFFELCTPYNKVVVPHKTCELILHGVRDRRTLKELNPNSFSNFFRVVESCSLSDWNSILEAAQKLSGVDSEGFIVVDDAFHRVKVKSPAYVALSHLKEGLTQTRLLEICRNNESDEFLLYFPEYTELYSEIKQKYDSLVVEIEETYRKNNHIVEQKEFALTVKHLLYSGVLFGLRAGKVTSVKQALLETHINKLKELLCLP